MNNSFKVGDRVRCIGTSMGKNDFDQDYGGAGWKLGREFTIDHLTNTPQKRKIAWEEPKEGFGVWTSHLEIIANTPKEVQLRQVIMEEIRRLI